MSVAPRQRLLSVPGRLGTTVANPSWPQRWVVRADVRTPRGCARWSAQAMRTSARTIGQGGRASFIHQEMTWQERSRLQFRGQLGGLSRSNALLSVLV
jgi:hypothetical protein